MRTTRPPRPHAFDSLRQEAYLNLWRTYDRLHALEEALFDRYGLTPQQYNALRLLRGAYPQALPTLRLAARLVSRAPDITRLLDRLERRGLIARRRHATNRRVVLVRILEPGLRLLAELDDEVAQCHEDQLGHLTDAQVQDLIELLQSARRPHEHPEGPWSAPAGATGAPDPAPSPHKETSA